jgi:hypothetical protein
MIISDLALNTSIFITSVIIVAISSLNSDTKKNETLDVPLKSEEVKIISPPPKEQIELYNLKLKCIKLEKSSDELLNTIKKDLK